MSQQYPKRLIEVDLPIRRISAHARREKSIRHGHISTLHIWWARRPLAACRAVICASLWPDPADPLCPQSFRDRAVEIIYEFARAAAGSKEIGEHCDHETWLTWQSMAKKGALDSHNEAHWNILRFALLDFIADFANWDNSTVKEYLDASRALTQAAHEGMGGESGTRPLVADPFAGGGSIPLEALRVGADAFASDLNPIPVLLNKVTIEYIPKYGHRLADEVQKWGEWIKQEAEKQLAELYPKDPDGSTPLAYLWARTIRCEGPGCGAEIPLVRSFLLGKEDARSIGLSLEVSKRKKEIRYTISESENASSFQRGTLKRGSATCPVCEYTTPGNRVRAQSAELHGGANESVLLAVYCASEGKQRFYRSPCESDYQAVTKAKEFIEKRQNTKLDDGTTEIPYEQLPYLRSIFNVNLIGIHRWDRMFSNRQLAALLYIASLVRNCAARLSRTDGDLGVAVSTVLALMLDRQADYLSSICTWVQSGQFVGHTFAQGQSLPIKWDFAEVAPFAPGSGNWEGAVGWVTRVLIAIADATLRSGTVEKKSATEPMLPDNSVQLIVTDPPYYDAVPYADLSDFFYVWLKRSVGALYPSLFHDSLSQKSGEIVQLAERNEAYAYKTKQYFESLMGKALQESRRMATLDGLAVVVFAHKETAAWETMLQAVISGGWVVVASWPIDTERSGRLRAMGSAALASSVHLVCRPRSQQTGVLVDQVGDWRDILHELPKRIHEWMPRLAEEGVVGADAIFACLGPALEIFSRYARVEKANGDTVGLREYLEHVWAAVAKEALAQVFQGADTTGFEPDARLTAMWLWTLNAPQPSETSAEDDEDEIEDEEDEAKKPKTSGFRLEYDAARKIAQGLGATLENLTHLVQVKGDQARLLPVAERTRYLFGKDQEEPARPARKKAAAQINMFAELTGAEDAETAWQEKTVSRIGESTLDRVHQAMILFAAGRGEALKRFIVDDGVGQDGKFWRLAQALSALYPTGTEERRWVEGVMARKKQFGF